MEEENILHVGDIISVELIGGALDGHLTQVPLREAPYDVYLFGLRFENTLTALAYRLCWLSVGSCWQLHFLGKVGKASKGTGNTQEEEVDCG